MFTNDKLYHADAKANCAEKLPGGKLFEPKSRVESVIVAKKANENYGKNFD